MMNFNQSLSIKCLFFFLSVLPSNLLVLKFVYTRALESSSLSIMGPSHVTKTELTFSNMRSRRYWPLTPIHNPPSWEPLHSEIACALHGALRNLHTPPLHLSLSSLPCHNHHSFGKGLYRTRHIHLCCTLVPEQLLLIEISHLHLINDWRHSLCHAPSFY